jgi:hypothetical protein
MLRSLGVHLDGPTLMLGASMSVALNTSVPSSALKKNHNAIAYHRVREAIAAKVMGIAFIKGEENVSDILTKLKKIIIWSRIGFSVSPKLKNERYIYL